MYALKGASGVKKKKKKKLRFVYHCILWSISFQNIPNLWGTGNYFYWQSMFIYIMYNLKRLNSKTEISIFINLRYLRLKLLKNKENNKKICHIFHHYFKNIPYYVMSEVLKRFYFALFDDGLTLKTLKLAFIGFWIQTLHLYVLYYTFTFVSQNEGFSDKKCYNSKSIHPILLKIWKNICFVKRKRLMIGFVGTCSIKQNVSVYVCIFWICKYLFFNMKKAEYFEKASLKCSYMFIPSTLSVNEGYYEE